MSEMQEQVRKLEGALEKCVVKNVQLKQDNGILAFEADHWREIAYNLGGIAPEDDQPVPYQVTEKGTATAGRANAAGLKTRPPDGKGDGTDSSPPAPLPEGGGSNGGGHGEDAKTVVIDVDGVLAKYDGWDGEFTPIGLPIVDQDGVSARVFCEGLQDFGYRVIISTCRTPRPDGHDDPLAEEQVVTWLEEHDIPYDHLHLGPNKPVGDVYLDDRALRFTGSYLDALREICNVRPWWDGDAPPSLGERHRATGDLREEGETT